MNVFGDHAYNHALKCRYHHTSPPTTACRSGLIGEPISSAELAARLAYEGTTPAQRLVALEVADPSQQRPPRQPSWLDRVDYIDLE